MRWDEMGVCDGWARGGARRREAADETESSKPGASLLVALQWSGSPAHSKPRRQRWRAQMKRARAPPHLQVVS